MLVLSRRALEEIVIGGNIRIRVTAINGTKVKLGISAPSEVSVIRTELLPARPTARRRREQRRRRRESAVLAVPTEKCK